MKQLTKLTVKDIEITVSQEEVDGKIVIVTEVAPIACFRNFKRGDVLRSEHGYAVIFDKYSEFGYFDSIPISRHQIDDSWDLTCFCHATESEKAKFFEELKAQGKRWNAETLELEDIPEELKAGDLVIAWDKLKENDAIVGVYKNKRNIGHIVSEVIYDNAVKFESMEQYEKIRKG